jgi:hypothetical protein
MPHPVIHHVKNRPLLLCVIAAALLTACGAPQSVQSSAPPESHVISFPSSDDHTKTTVLLSAPSEVQAGVSARALAVQSFDGQRLTATLLALDGNGNLGVEGNVYVRSSRSQKKNIAPYRVNALRLVRDVKIVTFRYANESGPATHVGFIAQDVPDSFTNPAHDAMNVTNTISVELAATQELAAQVRELQAQVSELKSALRRSGARR